MATAASTWRRKKPDEAASGVSYNEVDDFLAVKAVNAAVNAAAGRHRSGLETYFIYSLNTEGSCMRIACLAWGSLLWKTGALKLASRWQPGGPALPLEFARDSDDSDELAIVLCETASLMPTFYALLDTSDLAAARAMLAQREKIDATHPEWVGSIPTVDDNAPDARIAAWLANQPFDAVVWTALPPKFQGEEGRAPTAAEAIAFLAALPAPVHAQAEDYVRRVPASIRTQYRIQFEEELGWTPLAHAG